jgi:hypothetical protein
MRDGWRASYDLGFFDKDHQGWCARRTTVSAEGDLVTVVESGDDNGENAYTRTATYRRGPERADTGLVALLGPTGGVAAYFDRAVGRIRLAFEQDSAAFAPPVGVTTGGGWSALGAALLPVAQRLGLGAHTVPPMPLGPLAPRAESPHMREAVGESVHEGCRWTWMLRTLPPQGDTVGPLQWSLRIADASGRSGAAVQVFVQSPRCATCTVSVAPPDRDAVVALRQEALAGWAASHPTAEEPLSTDPDSGAIRRGQDSA